MLRVAGNLVTDAAIALGFGSADRTVEETFACEADGSTCAVCTSARPLKPFLHMQSITAISA